MQQTQGSTGPLLAVLAVLAVVFSGCTTGPDQAAHLADGGVDPTDASGYGGNANQERLLHIAGIVQTPDFLPVAGANVTVRELDLSTRTGPDGRFEFSDLPLGDYVVFAQAPGLGNGTLTVRAGQTSANLVFILEPVVPEIRHDTVKLKGRIQCAAEYVIISPSCDTILTFVDPTFSLFEDTSTFDLGLEGDWRTVVTDVDFDPSASPGTAGLRITVQGIRDTSQLNEYEQYGRFADAGPFTFHLRPGETYPDGVAPLPGNLTQLRFRVFPQSHGWHATCTDPAPPEAPCFLGVGIGVDITFTLYVTTFIGAPAPEGWSFLQ